MTNTEPMNSLTPPARPRTIGRALIRIGGGIVIISILLSLTADRVNSVSPTLAGWFWVSPFIAFPLGITVAAVGSGLTLLGVHGLTRKQVLGRWSMVVGAGMLGLSLAGWVVVVGSLLGSENPPPWVNAIGAFVVVGTPAALFLILGGFILNRRRRDVAVRLPGEIPPASRRKLASSLVWGGAFVAGVDLVLNSGVPTSAFAFGLLTCVIGMVLLLAQRPSS